MCGHSEDWRRVATKHNKHPKSSCWLSSGVAIRLRNAPALRPDGYRCSAKGNLEHWQIHAIKLRNLANQARIMR